MGAGNSLLYIKKTTYKGYKTEGKITAARKGEPIMTREKIFEKLNEIFRDVFFNPDITLTDATASQDIEGWDSLTHITLIGMIEDEFRIKFSMEEIVSMSNVGEMVNTIMKQMEQKS